MRPSASRGAETPRASLATIVRSGSSSFDIGSTASPGNSKQSNATPGPIQRVFSRIESNHWFQNFTLLVVCVNTLWIFIDVEWNNEKLRDDNGNLPLEDQANVIENLFASYFSAELLIRFLAFRRKLHFYRDKWFMFDSLLVTLMVLETWLFPIIAMIQQRDTANGSLSRVSSLRILRLLRLTRMARLMRYSPELMTIVKGMLRAMQAVTFIIIFIFVNIYIFGIFFTNELGTPGYSDPPDANIPSAMQLMGDLGSSMMTLITIGVLGDNVAQTYVALKAQSLMYLWIFALFEVITGVTLLNMLTGALCQVIEETSREEAESRQVSELRTCLVNAFQAVDVSNDGQISEEEWSQIKDNPKVRTALQQLGVEDTDIEDRLTQMQESLFGRTSVDEKKDEGDDTQGPVLTFEEFAEKFVELRWDMSASALDIEMLKGKISDEDKLFKRRFDTLEARLARLFLARGGLRAARGQSEPQSPRHLEGVPTDALLEALRSRPIARRGTGHRALERTSTVPAWAC